MTRDLSPADVGPTADDLAAIAPGMTDDAPSHGIGGMQAAVGQAGGRDLQAGGFGPGAIASARAGIESRVRTGGDSPMSTCPQ